MIEGLQDLDALLLPHRELPDAGARLDGEPIPLRELCDATLDRARPEQERAAHSAMVAEDDVLRDGERRNEAEVLVHHRDPRVERVARGREVDGLPKEPDLALVGPVEPGEDVGQRRFARAVLAQQGVHLAGGRLEVDVVVRNDCGEALGDAPHLDCGGRRRGGGSLPVLVSASPWRYR